MACSSARQSPKCVCIWLAVSRAPQRQPHSIRGPGGRPRLAFKLLPRRFKSLEAAGQSAKCVRIQLAASRAPQRQPHSPGGRAFPSPSPGRGGKSQISNNGGASGRRCRLAGLLKFSPTQTSPLWTLRSSASAPAMLSANRVMGNPEALASRASTPEEEQIHCDSASSPSVDSGRP